MMSDTMKTRSDTGKKKTNGQQTESSKKPTGVRYLTIHLKAQLMNTQTGRSFIVIEKQKYRHKSKHGFKKCPPVKDTTEKALKQIARKLARHLSPQLI